MLVVLQSHDIEAKASARPDRPRCPRLVAALELKAAATVGQRTVVTRPHRKGRGPAPPQESEIADQKQKLARTQKKIEHLHHSVQVTALEHELASPRRINRLEDAELESMERGGSLDAQRRRRPSGRSEAAQQARAGTPARTG